MTKASCVARTRSLCGEGPIWCARERVLYWIDCLKPAIHRFNPATGKDEIVAANLPEMIFGLALRQQGGFVLVASDGISFLDVATGTRTEIGDPESDLANTMDNDGACDRQGRLWFGTSDDGEKEPIGSLYRLDHDLTFHKIDTGFVVANGPAFSPDGTIMYFADSLAGKIFAYRIDPSTGAASNRRIFAHLPSDHGVPDGMTVDSEGFLWNAHLDGGRIARYAPDGTIDRVIEMPIRKPTSCAFGGERLDTLYVTSGSVDFPPDPAVLSAPAAEEEPGEGPVPGGLFAVDTGFRGLPETPFAG